MKLLDDIAANTLVRDGIISTLGLDLRWVVEADPRELHFASSPGLRMFVLGLKNLDGTPGVSFQFTGMDPTLVHVFSPRQLRKANHIDVDALDKLVVALRRDRTFIHLLFLEAALTE
jgi:hypothetical protein